jgi:adenosylcobinamide kinase/adenosylcobinamide-phosphate guanylyltransferase
MFLATCPPVDEETAERIRAHRLARSEKEWDTVEEFTNIVSVLRNSKGKYQIILVDCLTLWLNNLIFSPGTTLTEETTAGLCRDLIDTCSGLSGYIFFVANEVGMGIVPDNPISRRFRDVAGRCNQLIAAAADEVILMICGIPLWLKGGDGGRA